MARNCTDLEAQLVELLYEDELSDERAASLRSALSQCPEQAERLRSWKEVQRLIGALPQREPEPDIHYNILRAARAEVAGASEPRGWLRWLGGLGGAPAFATVGLLIMVGGATLLLTWESGQDAMVATHAPAIAEATDDPGEPGAPSALIPRSAPPGPQPSATDKRAAPVQEPMAASAAKPARKAKAPKAHKQQKMFEKSPAPVQEPAAAVPASPAPVEVLPRQAGAPKAQKSTRSGSSRRAPSAAEPAKSKPSRRRAKNKRRASQADGRSNSKSSDDDEVVADKRSAALAAKRAEAVARDRVQAQAVPVSKPKAETAGSGDELEPERLRTGVGSEAAAIAREPGAAHDQGSDEPAAEESVLAAVEPTPNEVAEPWPGRPAGGSLGGSSTNQRDNGEASFGNNLAAAPDDVAQVPPPAPRPPQASAERAPTTATSANLTAARAADARGNPQQAVTLYLRFLDGGGAHPEFVKAQLELAAIYDRLGNSQRALEIYRQVARSGHALSSEARRRVEALTAEPSSEPTNSANSSDVLE